MAVWMTTAAGGRHEHEHGDEHRQRRPARELGQLVTAVRGRGREPALRGIE